MYYNVIMLNLDEKYMEYNKKTVLFDHQNFLTDHLLLYNYFKSDGNFLTQ